MTRKQFVEGKLYFVLQLLSLSSRVITGGTQGRDLKAGTDSEATRVAAYWLIPLGLLMLISYRIKDH